MGLRLLLHFHSHHRGERVGSRMLSRTHQALGADSVQARAETPSRPSPEGRRRLSRRCAHWGTASFIRPLSPYQPKNVREGRKPAHPHRIRREADGGHMALCQLACVRSRVSVLPNAGRLRTSGLAGHAKEHRRRRISLRKPTRRKSPASSSRKRQQESSKTPVNLHMGVAGTAAGGCCGKRGSAHPWAASVSTRDCLAPEMMAQSSFLFSSSFLSWPVRAGGAFRLRWTSSRVAEASRSRLGGMDRHLCGPPKAASQLSIRALAVTVLRSRRDDARRRGGIADLLDRA